MSIKQRTKFYSKLCFSLCFFFIQFKCKHVVVFFPGGEEEDKINQGEKQKKNPTSFSNTNKNHIQWMIQKSIFSTKANTNSSCAHFHGFFMQSAVQVYPPLPKCSLSLHREVQFWAIEESKCARPWTCSWHLSVLLQPVEIRQTLILRQLPPPSAGRAEGVGRGGGGGCGSELRSKSHLETGGNFRQNRKEKMEVVNEGGLCSGICLDWFSSLQCKNWV